MPLSIHEALAKPSSFLESHKTPPAALWSYLNRFDIGLAASCVAPLPDSEEAKT
jgi:hypothetical protein